jgi:hypothetical protein
MGSNSPGTAPSERRMAFKISDLCLVVAASALGARLSLLVSTLNWPFDNRMFLAMFLGGVVLWPLVFFKQFVIEHRRTRLRFGEWLWTVFFLWFLLVWSLIGVRSELGLYALIYGGLLINPLLLCGVCINLALLRRRCDDRPAIWSDVVGSLITAALSIGVICFIFHLPPI